MNLIRCLNNTDQTDNAIDFLHPTQVGNSHSNYSALALALLIHTHYSYEAASKLNLIAHFCTSPCSGHQVQMYNPHD